MPARKGWTCQRTTAGRVCKFRNQPRTRKCGMCGKPRPARKRPAHMIALTLTYEQYVELNGGEHCGICGSEREPGDRRLHRDHDHRRGTARGILCFPCNSALRPYMTAEWCQKAAAYLDRPGLEVVA